MSVVTLAYCRMMARYNAWQNNNLLTAAETLDEAARGLDRGAFFGSISRTLSHLLWGDMMWLSRIDGGSRPPGGTTESAEMYLDWGPYRAERARADAQLTHWSEQVTQATIDGELRWYSGLLGRDVARPMGVCLAHMFNHQTHHRGQIHAMLTAAGARPGDTDLFLMPDPSDQGD